jgi:hypothetical protein
VPDGQLGDVDCTQRPAEPAEYPAGQALVATHWPALDTEAPEGQVASVARTQLPLPLFRLEPAGQEVAAVHCAPLSAMPLGHLGLAVTVQVPPARLPALQVGRAARLVPDRLVPTGHLPWA